MISLLGYVFSFLGDPRIWIILSVLTFAVRMVYRKKKIDKLLWTRAFIIFVGVAMGLAFLSSVVLKDIFQIPRPCSFSESDSNFSPYCLDDPSFPSGHATTGFAVATGLFLLLRKKVKFPTSLLIYLVGILPAIGRVMQGVHTFADITAGAALGTVFSLVFYFVINRLYKKFKK